ncbi:class I adenylate-forming enzyme family protein [Curvibacter sp. HBC61]|uniref:Class I adenylate-forming enzyme family protein n=1 Tax=Curvibacter cyanobacteriorum TaxID=3026422 RepID=A0ABT5MWC8_9BURK|nr:class I adenylate-forming enzyme family protein [Curvibacter sp. HBC61]MDD0837606.1 class I adenylate-forming enzyme family protein [Curvibacter sp. HBC61]
MTAPSTPVPSDFHAIPDRIREHARAEPQRPALLDAPEAGGQRMSYAELDQFMDRVAASLQRDGVQPGEAIAVCASSSVTYAAVFLGALRAGVVVAPLAPGSTPQALAGMLGDAQARLLFLDAAAQATVADAGQGRVTRIALDGSDAGQPLTDWLAPAGHPVQAVALQPAWPFNIIYSSGTTGTPKGIVQSHGMRAAHVNRGAVYGYGPRSLTLLSTPLYSNTTLVVFFPTLAFGGTVLLMPKFDAGAYLRLAQDHHMTHTMLVPVQYQRLMAHPAFEAHDLSHTAVKFCTSAPFHADLKADVLKRWPGGLVEFYGMTEGGGTCILEAHLHPDKLHTVGRPAETHDIRLIDEQGVEVAPGEAGEVVGHSAGMMTGYHGQPEKTREAEWFAPDGKRFIRTGDIGRFDADGFLTLFDRKKDMIISGGFNIYPSDLEALLREHPAVAEAAVVGVPSVAWGETPVAFVVARPGQALAADALRDWLNARVGKTQRLSDLTWVDELPRSAIGKVLKRELRDAYGAAAA